MGDVRAAVAAALVPEADSRRGLLTAHADSTFGSGGAEGAVPGSWGPRLGRVGTAREPYWGQ